MNTNPNPDNPYPLPITTAANDVADSPNFDLAIAQMIRSIDLATTDDPEPMLGLA